MDSSKAHRWIDVNPNLSLGVTLFECMKKFSNRTLQYLPDTSKSDTYEQVLTRCVRTALKLKEKGIKKNDVVSMCSYNHGNCCVPLFATLFLGAIPANFDPRLSDMETVHLLKLVQPKVIFVGSDAVEFMEKNVTESKVTTELVVFGDSEKYPNFSEYLKPQPHEANFRPVDVDADDTALIMFSSGTTGMPKGICLSHRSILLRIPTSHLHVVKIDTDPMVALLFTTFYWISAVACFIEIVVHGDSIVVRQSFDPVQAWKDIDRYKVTYLFLSTNLAYQIYQNHPKNVDASSLKVLLVGGYSVGSQMIDGLRAIMPNINIINGYGQTEAPSLISRFDPTNPEDVKLMIQKPGSCGRIIPMLQWKVVDPDTGKELGPNEKGELRYKGEKCMNGYYKMDASAAFDSEGYIKTGDIVYYDEDYCLFIVDRIKAMFKYKGWHVVPAVIEEVLLSHPAVKEAAVVGVPAGSDGDHPMGVVVLHEHYKNITPKEIESYVEKRVTDFQKLRGGVKFVDKLLRTATGKVKRNVVRDLILEGKY
ncbi:hypothetical protein NQ318_010092 [Aromia moschata]|uniref:Luciferin 4-monooxygenase n=1 Tax=Aromia moschata TaxID=1265417 RepID=A0AAV8Y9C2_9CUCU|nr:hypothetical protein NQ318_010092 [Aromia moschata]